MRFEWMFPMKCSEEKYSLVEFPMGCNPTNHKTPPQEKIRRIWILHSHQNPLNQRGLLEIVTA